MSDSYANVTALRRPESVADKSAIEESANTFQGVPQGLPNMPDGMGQIAKNHWVTIGKRLEQAGLITKIDLSVFRRYCETYELYVESQKMVAELGEFQKTPNEYFQLAPWSVSRDRAAAALLKLEDKLFLNPASRQRIKLDNPNQGSFDL